MFLNLVVLAGTLSADADIVECQESPGRFKIEFNLVLGARRKQIGTVAERSTCIHVKFFASEAGANYFQRQLYQGNEVVVRGELSCRTSLSNGSSSLFYFIDAHSTEVVEGPEQSRPRGFDEGHIGNGEEPFRAEQAAPTPRRLSIQRPGTPQHTAPSHPRDQHPYRPQVAQPAPPAQKTPQAGNSPSPSALLYRDKGENFTPVLEADAGNLCRW